MAVWVLKYRRACSAWEGTWPGYPVLRERKETHKHTNTTHEMSHTDMCSPSRPRTEQSMGASPPLNSRSARVLGENLSFNRESSQAPLISSSVPLECMLSTHRKHMFYFSFLEQTRCLGRAATRLQRTEEKFIRHKDKKSSWRALPSPRLVPCLYHVCVCQLRARPRAHACPSPHTLFPWVPSWEGWPLNDGGMSPHP